MLKSVKSVKVMLENDKIKIYMVNKQSHKKTWKLLSIFAAIIIVLGGIYTYVHYHDRNTVAYTSKQQIQNAIKSPVTAN